MVELGNGRNLSTPPAVRENRSALAIASTTDKPVLSLRTHGRNYCRSDAIRSGIVSPFNQSFNQSPYLPTISAHRSNPSNRSLQIVPAPRLHFSLNLCSCFRLVSLVRIVQRGNGIPLGIMVRPGHSSRYRNRFQASEGGGLRPLRGLRCAAASALAVPLRVLPPLLASAAREALRRCVMPLRCFAALCGLLLAVALLTVARGSLSAAATATALPIKIGAAAALRRLSLSLCLAASAALPCLSAPIKIGAARLRCFIGLSKTAGFAAAGFAAVALSLRLSLCLSASALA